MSTNKELIMSAIGPNVFNNPGEFDTFVALATEADRDLQTYTNLPVVRSMVEARDQFRAAYLDCGASDEMIREYCGGLIRQCGEVNNRINEWSSKIGAPGGYSKTANLTTSLNDLRSKAEIFAENFNRVTREASAEFDRQRRSYDNFKNRVSTLFSPGITNATIRQALRGTGVSETILERVDYLYKRYIQEIAQKRRG